MKTKVVNFISGVGRVKAMRRGWGVGGGGERGRGGEMGDHSEPVAGEKEEGMLHPLLLSDEGED